MAGVRAAIDVQGLAGHECGRLQVQHRLDDLLDLAHSPERDAARRGMHASLARCIGVLMTPGATAFTRMPLSAYSIASDLVTASSPPLVRDAKRRGTPFTG